MSLGSVRVRETASGPADTFARFYEETYQRVTRVVYGISGDMDLAQDCSQEAFARALDRWTRLEGQSWAAGWVMTTAMNLVRREHRRRPRRMELMDVPAARVSDPELWELVRQLPRRQQQVVILRCVLDLSTRQTARVLRCSEGTVKVHFHRARGTLATMLGESR